MTDRIGDKQLGCDPEYFTGRGALTSAGADAGRWIDDHRRSGNVDWVGVADDLGVHPRAAEQLYRIWC